MSDAHEPGFSTLAIHAGAQPDPTTGARATPIYQTTSFVFDDVDHAASLFGLQAFGNIYSRITNPTVAVLEERIAALEGGTAGLGVASGHAAQVLVFHALMQPGDEFVASRKLYGGSINQFTHSYKNFGWNVVWADPDDVASFEAAITPKTKAIFIESIANPGGVVVDIEAIAAIARRAGVPLIVDNTMATPYLIRPFEHGADIIVHSATKFLGGHGNSIGGLIVDGGTFDWVANAERFPMLNNPEPAYHGVVYTEALGPAAFIGRCRVVPLRNTGAALAPFNAFLIMQGLETLALRMERHCENAEKVANFLQDHPSVEWVNYATLANSPYKATCDKICGGKASGILSFGIKGGREAGAKFIDALDLILRLVNIGDAKSLACHPATTTHRQLNPEELKSAGVSEDLVRLSIGIEHVDDIIADITQALDKAQA